jgi:hypothetical protein
MQSVVKEQETLLNRALPILIRVVINLIVIAILIAVILRLLENFL